MRQRVAAVSAPTIPRVAHDIPFAPTSSVQQGIWFLEALSPTPSLHNIPGALRLFGKLDVEALTAAMNAVIARHEILRTTFSAPEGRPIQTVIPALALVPRLNIPAR